MLPSVNGPWRHMAATTLAATLLFIAVASAEPINYVVLYTEIEATFGPLTNLSPVVDNLLSGIASTDTWGFPVEQVTVLRVIANDETVQQTPAPLDWDYVRQYPYASGNVIFSFSVPGNATSPPSETLLFQAIQAAALIPEIYAPGSCESRAGYVAELYKSSLGAEIDCDDRPRNGVKCPDEETAFQKCDASTDCAAVLERSLLRQPGPRFEALDRCLYIKTTCPQVEGFVAAFGRRASNSYNILPAIGTPAEIAVRCRANAMCMSFDADGFLSMDDTADEDANVCWYRRLPSPPSPPTPPTSPPSPPSLPPSPPNPPRPPPVAYNYVAKYVNGYNIEDSDLSTFVDDLLSAFDLLSIPLRRVTAIRVTVDDVEVPPPASGTLDWDYLRQAAIFVDEESNVDIAFSITLDSSAQPPNEFLLYLSTEAVDVVRVAEAPPSPSPPAPVSSPPPAPPSPSPSAPPLTSPSPSPALAPPSTNITVDTLVWATSALSEGSDAKNTNKLVGKPGRAVQRETQCKPRPARSWVPQLQGPRMVEAYFASGPVGGQVREVVLYTLSLGALQQPVTKLELLVQPAGTSTKGGRKAKYATAATNSKAAPAPVRVTVFDAGTAPSSSFTLACPGLSRFRVPAPTRATLPRGLTVRLTVRAFRQATVVGVRVTVSEGKVDGARQLPNIAGVGLDVA